MINILEGKTLTGIENRNNSELIFTTSDGKKYKMWHSQDCCESVSLEDITGDLTDIIGSPILVAEERTNCGRDDHEDYQWTFYEFRTNKGSVTLRWYGTSNGYYSTRVDFEAC